MAIIVEQTIKVNALYYFACHIMRYDVGWRNGRTCYNNSLVLIKNSSVRTRFSHSLCITKFEQFGNSLVWVTRNGEDKELSDVVSGEDNSDQI